MNDYPTNVDLKDALASIRRRLRIWFIVLAIMILGLDALIIWVWVQISHR